MNRVRMLLSMAPILLVAAPGIGAGGDGITGAAEPWPWSLVSEIAKNGTLGLLCIVILWSYRRDFYRRQEDHDRELAEREAERDRLEAVLERSTAAIVNATAATARQTDATHRLARSVEKLEEKVG